MLQSTTKGGTAIQTSTDARLKVCRKKVLRTDREGLKAVCLFADGTSILISNFLASSIRPGDELLFVLGHGGLECGDTSSSSLIPHGGFFFFSHSVDSFPANCFLSEGFCSSVRPHRICQSPLKVSYEKLNCRSGLRWCQRDEPPQHSSTACDGNLSQPAACVCPSPQSRLRFHPCPQFPPPSN